MDVSKIEGVWYIQGSKILTDFESNWAEDEPGENEDKKCAYMSKAHE